MRVRAAAWVIGFALAWAGAIAIGEQVRRAGEEGARTVVATADAVTEAHDAGVRADTDAGTPEAAALPETAALPEPPVAFSLCPTAGPDLEASLSLLPVLDGPPLLVVGCGARAHVVRIVRTESGLTLERVRTFDWHGYAAPSIPTLERPVAVDLEGDGTLDLVLPFHANAGDPSGRVGRGQVHVAPLDAAGAWSSPRRLAELVPRAIAAGELHDEPGTELAILEWGEPLTDRAGRIAVIAGGRVSRGRPSAGVACADLVIRDLDRDTHADAVVLVSGSSAAPSSLRVYRGDATGGLAPIADRPMPDAYTIGAGDLDGDGAPELVLAGYDVWLLRDPIAGERESLSVGEGASVQDVRDIDGDGRDEAIVSVRHALEVVRLRDGHADRTPWIPDLLPAWLETATIADLDGDGAPDTALVIRRPDSGGRELLIVPGGARSALTLPEPTPVSEPVDIVPLR